MKGWIYHVECPGDWSNAGKAGNYQILDAPHVMAMNKNPKWECVECGVVVEGYTPVEGCFACTAKEFFKDLKTSSKWSYPVIKGKTKHPFKRDSSIWDER
jgi:hypothetical protein